MCEQAPALHSREGAPARRSARRRVAGDRGRRGQRAAPRSPSCRHRRGRPRPGRRAAGSRPRSSARRAAPRRAGRRRAGGAPRRCATTAARASSRASAIQTRSRASALSCAGRAVERRAAVAQDDHALAERGDVLGLVRRDEHDPLVAERRIRARGSAAAARDRARRVGSSSTSSCGSPSSACASATRRRMPPDSLRMRRAGDVAEADLLEHAAHLAMARARVGHLLEDRDVVDELERRELAMKARLLRHVAEPAAHLGALARASGGIEAQQPQAPARRARARSRASA